jgi:NADPH2:quinone reductase
MDGTMKAVVARDYGPPEALAVAEVPVPLPGPGQIQVRTAAAALNPADLRSLSGVLAGLAPLRFPHIPGSDFAGTVTAIGAGVDRFAVGDEVFGTALPLETVQMASMFATPPSLTTGTVAEYAVFEADTPALALRPAALAADRAAALPIAGLTALAVLRAGRFQPGESVLVVGATGGVGSAVVPLLAAAKVRVVATAGAADEAYVRGLGAAEVIDRHAADLVAEAVRRRPDGFDALVNTALPGSRLVDAGRLLRPGGRLLNVAFPSPDPGDFDGRDFTFETVYGGARPGDLDELAALAADGSLPVSIGRRYRLDEAPRAYRDLVREHTRGKLVVIMDA